MSYYSSPEELAANPPETWRIEKRAERSWGLFIGANDEHPLQTFPTRRAALEERDNPDSRTRRAIEKDRRWYAGETPAGWKSWEECKAEREALERRQAERQLL